MCLSSQNGFGTEDYNVKEAMLWQDFKPVKKKRKLLLKLVYIFSAYPAMSCHAQYNVHCSSSTQINQDRENSFIEEEKKKFGKRWS